ncbi:MAG TPA: type II toxin-antitoxin system VapC family toxin [Pirellulaceae bacterium]|nr:type II toxin-antitoxin system VapC family toxin [Pirellulaceae bacterium]
MILLDTDHLVFFLRTSSSEANRLRDRLRHEPDDPRIAIVSAEEIFRGWLSEIRRKSDVAKQISPYHEFQRAIATLANWQILPWDAQAVSQFKALKQTKIRVGTMDLKIASIALAHGATLLTRNTADFERVPGLQIEDWLAS